MVAILTQAPPKRLVLPSFVVDIGDTPVDSGPIQLQCSMRNTDNGGDQEFEDIETFCQPGLEAPTVTKEMISVEFRWSFGALTPNPALAGVWNALKPIEGELVEFAYLIDGDSTSSPANPEQSGQLYIPFIPLINASVRRFTRVTLEFKIAGNPTYNTDGNPVFDHPFGGS
jgi:hypothetical protein